MEQAQKRRSKTQVCGGVSKLKGAGSNYWRCV